MKTSLKFKKTKGIYTNSTGSLTFNPETLEAHSYRWWKFVAKIEGLVIFNNYKYSVSTSKHQHQIRSLLAQLGIKIDLELPLPKGIQGFDLALIIETAEEHLCDAYLNEELKRQKKNQKIRERKLAAKLEDYLENEAHFRDYEIKSKDFFGSYDKVAVHQCVNTWSIVDDVAAALNSFSADGFSSVVFYV